MKHRSTVLALCAALSLASCVYDPYYLQQPTTQQRYDRSWSAAAGALTDQGLTITAQDRGSGIIRGERAGVTAKGALGWHSTGAATESSTIIASAKPPVKHIPSAPTPGPPSSWCSSRDNERSHPATGVVSPVRSLVNSLLTQTCRRALAVEPAVIGAPSVPKRRM